MPIREYRFTITGTLTVDDTTLQAALLGFEHVAPPGQPDISDDDQLRRQQEMASKPPREGMQDYLFHGHVRPMTWKLDRDMPGVGFDLQPLEVEEIGTPGEGAAWTPVRPEDR